MVDWQFDIADADIDDLAAGQTLIQSYTLTITDNDGGSTTETVTVTITGTNDAPVIETAPVDVILTEGIAPTALSSSGVVTFSDVDTLDSHIVTRGPVTVSGTYQGQPVPYGPEGLRSEDIAMAEAALVVNADGSWTFDMPASELVDRMAEGQVYVITSEITVTDDSGAANSTDTQTLTITLIGTNDAPEITSAVTTGSVTEIADLAAGENVDTLETTGQITFSDLDQADVHTVTVAPNSGGYLGAMTAIVSTDTENFGNQHAGEIDWTFQVDDSAIDSLAQGQVLTQSYTVTVTDNNGASDSEVVTLTITGTNDAPVVGTADDSGSVQAEVIDPTVTVGTGDMKFHVEQYQGYSTNNLNTMQSIMANPSAYGVTLYEADADFIDFVDYPVTGYSATNQPWPAAAATGQTHYTGVNDFFFARITTDFDVTSAGNYTFRTYNDDGLYLFVDGNLVINDPNYHGSQTFTGTVNLSEGQHSLELFFFEHGGAAVLELSVADSSGNFQLMGQGAAGLGGVGGEVALTDSGSIAFSDVDLTDAHTVSVTPNGAGYLGDLTTAVADVSTGDGEGSVDWEFMVSNADLEYLAEGETVTQTYTVTITDNTGASDSQQVTITLTGTNEAPVIGTADTTASVTEIADLAAGENATSHTVDGSINFSDVDTIDTHTVNVASNGAGYRGSMTAIVADASTGDNAGRIDWTFAIDDSAIDDLAAGQTLMQRYDITVDDGQGGTDTETVTVTITGTNDAPVFEASDTAGAVIESGNLDDGTVVAGTDVATGTMVSSDVDNGATAVWSGDAAGTYGSFTIDANSGDWTYTLDNGNALTDALAEGQSETETFTVTVTDDQGATATETVSIIVTGTNDVPTASAISAPTTDEDAGSVSIDLLATASDVDAADDLDVANVVVTSSDGRALSFSVDAETGAFSLDPSQYNDLAVGENATVTVSYDVIDSNGGIAANTATVLVEGRNDAPVAQSISGAVDEDAGQTQLSGNIDATSAPNLGRFYVFDIDTGASYTIARDTGSNNTYDQIAAQYLGSGNGIVAQVNPNNSGWGVASEVYVGGVGTPVDASQYSVTDTDGGPAAYQHGTYPEVLSVDDANKNVDQIALSLTGLTLSDGRVVDLDMNINGLDYEVNTTDDIAIGGVAFEANVTTPSDVVTISADYADVDTSDTHTFSVDVSGTVGQVTNNNDGTFTYDANGQYDHLAVGETTTDTFTYTVDDGNGGADTQTATITITGTNDAPTLQSNAGVLGFDEASATDSLARVVDGYGGFNWSTTGGIGGQSSAQQGDILASANGNAPSGPNAAWNGHASPLSIIEKTDGSTFVFNSASFASVTTATYGGELTSVTLTGYLNGSVVGTEVVNLGAFAEFFDWTSSLGAIDRLEITPQGPFNGGGWWAMDDFAYGDATEEDGAAIAIDLSSLGDDVDSDDDGTTLTYSIVTGPSEGSASITGTSLSFDPGSDFQDLDDGETRTVTIEVMATDSHGATATNTMSVVVGGVNDAPVAIAAAFSGDEDTNIAGAVAATDADGDALTYSVVTGSANGSVVMNADGTFVYTPSGDYNGADSFTFIANDGSRDSAPQTVSLTVNAVNDAPVADTLVVSGNEDTTLNSAVTGSDVDGDSVTFAVVSGPSNGSVAMNADGTFSYTPDANYNGGDSFTFVANDGTENSFEQVVAITVNPVNDAPEASALSISGNEDTAISGAVTGSDLDGDALTYGVVSGPSNGSVSMNADGTFTYTPGANYNGGDSFTFRASDGSLNSVDQVVSITVNPVNDAPTASDAAVSGNEDTTIAGTVVGADVDGDALTFDLVSGTSNGTVTLNSDGTYSYAPNANFNGTDSFTFRSNDGFLTSAVQTVSITVNPVNDAPVAVADSVTTDEDTPALISVLANDTDVEGDTLSITSATVTSGSGTVSFIGTDLIYESGTAYQSLNAGETAAVQISYTISDGNGGTATGTTNVTITGVTDSGPVIANYVTLTTGNDTWTGQSGNQQVDALAGDDRVYGDFSSWYRSYYNFNDTWGDDIINAGPGGDVIYGDGDYLQSYRNYYGSQYFNAGSDFLYGDAGNDTMIGDIRYALIRESRQIVELNGGDDVMEGAGGADTMFGDLDYVYVYRPNYFPNIDINGGNDTMDGGSENDVMVGDFQQARTYHYSSYYYNKLIDFNGGDDAMTGGSGDDLIVGDIRYIVDEYSYYYNPYFRGGDDDLRGGAGSDEIYGDFQSSNVNLYAFLVSGADTIEGGEGNDDLYGDYGSSTGTVGFTAGADVFVFNPNSGSDNIHDFQDGVDRLDVSGYGFTSAADMTIGTSGSQTYIQFSATDVVYLQSIFTITDDDFIF